jgi:hypothetical protein
MLSLSMGKKHDSSTFIRSLSIVLLGVNLWDVLVYYYDYVYRGV